MPPRLPNSWVEQVYAASSIVEVVSQYVSLQSRGRRYWGLCPFHHEKTASFSVNPDMNLYYCFGCKASGNIVQFLMEMENLTYPEALMQLAKQFNLPPPPVFENDAEEERKRTQRDRAIEATREAAVYYHELLWTQQGRQALDYLHQRGIDDNTIRRFGLGVSPDEWDSMLLYLQNKGFTKEELEQAALITVKESSEYDTFRNRVMFPIVNRYGLPIGFGARAMGNMQPKYLNTSESIIFNKRYNLYGINLLKRQRNLKQLFLVEGYLDVIMLSQCGISNTVATLGTSLTAEQARLMKNYAPEIWIAYDGDAAGQDAALRALDVFAQENIIARVLPLPEGKDPDDYVRQEGANSFLSLTPVAALSFRLQRLKAEFDFSNSEELRKYAKKACRLISLLREPVEVDHYLGKISLETGIEKEVLLAQVRSASKPAQQQQPQLQAEKNFKRKKQFATIERMNQPEFTLVSLLATGAIPMELVKLSDFKPGPFREIVALLMEGQRPSAIMGEAKDDELRSLVGELFNHLPDLGQEKALIAAEDCLRRIRVAKVNQRIQKLQSDIKGQEEQKKIVTLQLISELQNERKRLSSK